MDVCSGKFYGISLAGNLLACIPDLPQYGGRAARMTSRVRCAWCTSSTVCQWRPSKDRKCDLLCHGPRPATPLDQPSSLSGWHHRLLGQQLRLGPKRWRFGECVKSHRCSFSAGDTLPASRPRSSVWDPDWHGRQCHLAEAKGKKGLIKLHKALFTKNNVVKQTLREWATEWMCIINIQNTLVIEKHLTSYIFFHLSKFKSHSDHH